MILNFCQECYLLSVLRPSLQMLENYHLEVKEPKMWKNPNRLMRKLNCEAGLNRIHEAVGEQAVMLEGETFWGG